MASHVIHHLLGDFLGTGDEEAVLDTARERSILTNADKALLGATAVAGYVIARMVFSAVGVMPIPGVSGALLVGGAGSTAIGLLTVAVVFVGVTLLARPIVKRVRTDAPVFCAAVALLALPTHGGDLRNVLLDAGGQGVFLTLAVELLLLTIVVAIAYVAAGVSRVSVPQLDAADTAGSPPVIEDGDLDTATDRLAAVAIQTIVTLGLLSLLGQSPVKGQALLGVALAGGLAGWMTYKARRVRGSAYYVAGTLLAGVVAFVWTRFAPDGTAIAEAKGALAGAARSLPLHYATAGVAGTLYGYWAGRSGTN